LHSSVKQVSSAASVVEPLEQGTDLTWKMVSSFCVLVHVQLVVWFGLENPQQTLNNRCIFVGFNKLLFVPSINWCRVEPSDASAAIFVCN